MCRAPARDVVAAGDCALDVGGAIACHEAVIHVRRAAIVVDAVVAIASQSAVREVQCGADVEEAVVGVAAQSAVGDGRRVAAVAEAALDVAAQGAARDRRRAVVDDAVVTVAQSEAIEASADADVHSEEVEPLVRARHRHARRGAGDGHLTGERQTAAQCDGFARRGKSGRVEGNRAGVGVAVGGVNRFAQGAVADAADAVVGVGGAADHEVRPALHHVLLFKGTDVRSANASETTLICGRSVGTARIERRAATKQRHGLGWAAVESQRAEIGIYAGEVVRARQGGAA